MISIRVLTVTLTLINVSLNTLHLYNNEYIGNQQIRKKLKNINKR